MSENSQKIFMGKTRRRLLYMWDQMICKDSSEDVNKAFESLVEYVKHKFINRNIPFLSSAKSGKY